MGIFGTDTEWITNQYTFDNVDADKFRNHRFLTLVNYVLLYVGIVLKVVGMAADIYTLVTFGLTGESSNESKLAYIPPVAYSAVFIGCISLSFLILFFRWIQGYKIYQTRQIALSYFYAVPRNTYSILNYSRFCVFSEVSSRTFFNWYSFMTYFALKDWLNLLVADSPRQLFNGYTIFSTITNKATTSNIIEVIRSIATTDVRQAVILSLMTLSFVIWLVFIVRFVICLLCLMPLRLEIHKQGFKHGLKAYCCVTINDEVAYLVKRKNSELLLNDYRKGSQSSTASNGVAPLVQPRSLRMPSLPESEKANSSFSTQVLEKQDPFDMFVAATPRRRSTETDSVNEMLHSFPLPPQKASTFSEFSQPLKFQPENPFASDASSTETQEPLNPIYRTYDGSDPLSNVSDPFLGSDTELRDFTARRAYTDSEMRDFTVQKAHTDTELRGVPRLPSLPDVEQQQYPLTTTYQPPPPTVPPKDEMSQLYGTDHVRRVRRNPTDPYI